MQKAFKENSEAEESAEGEESEVVGMEDVGAMEVDKEGEDKAVVVEEVK